MVTPGTAGNPAVPCPEVTRIGKGPHHRVWGHSQTLRLHSCPWCPMVGFWGHQCPSSGDTVRPHQHMGPCGGHLPGAQPNLGCPALCGGSMGTMGSWWGRCGHGGDAVAMVAVLDSGVQPKLTGAHGPERPKAAYSRIIALNSADSTLSSESPGPGRAGGAPRTPHPLQGGLGWGGITPGLLLRLPCGRAGVTRVGFARLSIPSLHWEHQQDVPPVPCVPSCPPSLASSPAPAQPAGWGHGTGG